MMGFIILMTQQTQPEVLRLPRLSNIPTPEGILDTFGKVFYPHHNSHRPRAHPSPTKDSKPQYLHKPKSKSVANLQISFPIDYSKLLVEDQTLVSPTKESPSKAYQKKLKHYHNHLKNRSRIIIETSLQKPSEQAVVLENYQSVDHPTPRNIRQQYNSFARKQKQESLKSALVVEKQKIDSSELRIRSIIKNIFPLTSEMAMSQFIDRFQQLRRFAQKSKDQEKKVNKLILSNKQEPARKVQVLKQKKQKLEAELENEYKALFEKFFKDGDGANETFRKKFRKHISALSKTFNLQQFI